jgi:hypothetical protein
MPELPSSAPQAAPTVEPTNPASYDPAADTDPAALGDFHDTLSPYGTWADDTTYGTVWVPSEGVVGSDFAPYVTHGHWGLGAEGSWVWVSDFNWGWAPFHYGRWVWIGGRGWAWIPGRVYAAAWVVWQTGYYDDYYLGWAPMPPSWYWRGGVAFGLWFTPPAPYVFCSSRYVFSPHVRSYVVAPARVSMVAPHMRPYVAASPSVGPAAASASYRAALYTRGPNLADAHVPASAVPAQRVAPDARAIAYARPVAASARAYGAATPRSAINQYRAPSNFQAGARPVEVPRPQTSPQVRTYTSPAIQAPQSSSPSFSTPQHSFNPGVRSAPSMQPRLSPSLRSAPSVRGGRGR